MTSVTLELPPRIFQKASQVARATKRPIEQVVVEWIQPPVERAEALQEVVLSDLETMSAPQLLQIARSRSAPADAERLRQLLDLQEQRELTQAEHDEAVWLVEQEDLLTLRKAKALYLLKQRQALPEELAALGA